MDNSVLSVTLLCLKWLLITSGIVCISIGVFWVFFGKAFIDFDRRFSEKYRIPRNPDGGDYTLINRFFLKYPRLTAIFLCLLGVFLVYNFLVIYYT